MNVFRIICKFFKRKSMATDKYNIGSTEFNAQDRGAILNLLNGVTIYYDNYEPEGLQNYLDCYTEDGVFVLSVPGQKDQAFYKNPGPNQQGMYKFFASRIESFVANGIQNRHNFTNKVVIEQRECEAVVIINMLFVVNHTYNTVNGDKFVPMYINESAQYTMDVVKEDSRWLIKRMYALVDGNFALRLDQPSTSSL